MLDLNDIGLVVKKRKMDPMDGGDSAGSSCAVRSSYNFPSNNRISTEFLLFYKPLFRRDLIGHHSHPAGVNVFEFSDDGSFFVSGGVDGRVLLWPTDKALDNQWNPKPTEMSTKHEEYIACLAISPDNGRIFSGSEDRKIVIYDAKT